MTVLSGHSPLQWRKSSYSGGPQSSCVEAARYRDGLAVRDSKDPAGPALAFAATDWAAFVTAVRTR
jgi:hypothetical protein